MKVTSPASPTCKEKKENLHQFDGNERILVVDDEPFLVKAHVRQLTLLGYRVTATTNSEDALKKIQRDPKQFDLLLTDQMMPGLNGVELAKAVQRINPALSIILCTGHGNIFSQKEALAMGIARYVSKPIYRNELLRAIREVLDGK